MSRYTDKSLEEVMPIVEGYTKAYERRNGHPPDPKELLKKLKDLAEEKEKDAFFSSFEHLSPGSLRLAISGLTELKDDVPPNPKDGNGDISKSNVDKSVDNYVDKSKVKTPQPKKLAIKKS